MTVPRYWRNIGAYYRLEGIKCKNCGSLTFPPRNSCPKCHSKDVETVQLPRRGRIVSFSLLRSPPKGFEAYVPYYVVVVELENGVRVFGTLTDVFGEVKEGMEVEAVFRKISEDGEEGLIHYGTKFRPVARGC